MKRFFGNLIDILCLASCGIFVSIMTATVPIPSEGFTMPQEYLIASAIVLLLMLIFRRFTKMIWNVVYCVCTIVLVSALLEWATQGTLMPPVLKSIVAPYTLPALLEGACYYELGSFALLWLMGALCCHGFWRVTITAVGSYAVWLILALLLHIVAKTWLVTGDASPHSELQLIVSESPWVTAAFPGCLILCYAVLMSMYDALFMGWSRKEKSQEKKVAEKTAEPKKSAELPPKAKLVRKTVESVNESTQAAAKKNTDDAPASPQ